MKKNIILIVILLVVILIIGIICLLKYKEYEITQINLKKFNLTYEEFNKEELNGLDITTVINQATSNNEKYEIPKDDNGIYILDDKHSIEIYITMLIDGETYKMEEIVQADMNSFIRLFGEVEFKCTNLTYHESTGRVATMTFTATEY